MRNDDQIEYWNGDGGERWAANADRLDSLLTPFLDAILGRLMPEKGERLIDIGCGAGALTLRAAERVGAGGDALGLDVSGPLIEIARGRAELKDVPARFELADASAYSPERPADAAMSRFGVMFFDEPAEAFTSIRAGLRPGGRLVFACWQALAVNDWARLPLEVTLPFLAEPPEMPPPGAPGPFAFEDGGRVEDILGEAGWSDVEIAPWTGTLDLPGRTPEAGADFMLRLGPAARLVEGQDLDVAAVRGALETALAEKAGPDGQVALPAAAWIVSAKA